MASSSSSSNLTHWNLTHLSLVDDDKELHSCPTSAQEEADSRSSSTRKRAEPSQTPPSSPPLVADDQEVFDSRNKKRHELAPVCAYNNCSASQVKTSRELNLEKDFQRFREFSSESMMTPKLFLQYCVQNQLIRADRQAQPRQLVVGSEYSTLQLMDRELALNKLFLNISGRLLGSNFGQCQVDKSYAPIHVVYGGPGSGKSRFLDEVAHPNTRLKFLDQVKSIFGEKCYHHIKAAVGIAVTFNRQMPLLTSNTPGKLLACETQPTQALALRVFYSYFIDENRASWDDFANSVEIPFSLEDTFDLICSDLDQSGADSSSSEQRNRHLLVCVDEIFLGVFQRMRSDASPEQLRGAFASFISRIGRSMEIRTRVHFVLSSLSQDIIEPHIMLVSSLRAIIPLPMSALSPSSVGVLFRGLWDKSEYPKKTRLALLQFLLDAGGSPRILCDSAELLSRPPSRLDLQALRDCYSSASAFVSLDQVCVTRHLRSSLLLALKGETVGLSEYDPGVHHGLLLMPEKSLTTYHLIPKMAPALFFWISDMLSLDSTTNQLVKWVQEFLDLDCTQDKYNGNAFENQFLLLLNIRCLVFSMISSNPNILSTQTASPTYTINALMNILEGIFLPEGVKRVGPVFSTFYHIPAELRTVNDISSPDLLPDTVFIPATVAFPGIDAVLTLRNVSNQVVAFGIQLKWWALNDREKSNTPFSLSLLAESIFNTCKQHHKVLSEFILSGRFGFIFPAIRDLSPHDDSPPDDYSMKTFFQLLAQEVENVSISDKSTSKTSKKKKIIWAIDEDAQRMLLQAAQQNILIMGKEQLLKLFTPTLQSRLAFSPEFALLHHITELEPPPTDPSKSTW